MSYRRPDLNFSRRYPYAQSEYTESTITSRPEGKSKSTGGSGEGNENRYSKGKYFGNRFRKHISVMKLIVKIKKRCQNWMFFSILI